MFVECLCMCICFCKNSNITTIFKNEKSSQIEWRHSWWWWVCRATIKVPPWTWLSSRNQSWLSRAEAELLFSLPKFLKFPKLSPKNIIDRRYCFPFERNRFVNKYCWLGEIDYPSECVVMWELIHFLSLHFFKTNFTRSRGWSRIFWLIWGNTLPEKETGSLVTWLNGPGILSSDFLGT